DNGRKGGNLVHDVEDRQGIARARVRGAAEGGVIDVDGHAIAALGLVIEDGPGLDVERAADDLERGGVRAGHVQVVGPQPVVGDDDVGHLDRAGGAGVLGYRRDRVVQRDPGGGLVGDGGRRVNPELGVVEVTAAVLVDDVQEPVPGHGEAF